jgi:hypothetical protein
MLRNRALTFRPPHSASQWSLFRTEVNAVPGSRRTELLADAERDSEMKLNTVRPSVEYAQALNNPASHGEPPDVSEPARQK